MFKSLKSIADTYVTNKIIAKMQKTSANVGQAGTLDLFKLYDVNQISGSAATELSRLLIKFDLTPLRTLVSTGKIDLTHPTFNATIRLFDVYGGQPTPSNFTVDLYPLSRSFSEGRGRDLVKYQDNDVANFLSSSHNVPWFMPGVAFGTGSTIPCDFITTLDESSTKVSQYFVTGQEDLVVNVTNLVSATITNQIPDVGFRISFSPEIELDDETYFVKRFAGRNAFNEDVQPRLEIKFDDSILDDTQILELDTTCRIFLYNYSFGGLVNIPSGSTTLTGDNCLAVKLVTPISGGTYEVQFTGSQYKRGVNYVTGVYTSNVNISSMNPNVQLKLLQTGSVDFTPVWGSLDGTLGIHSGSTVTFNLPSRSSRFLDLSRYTVTATGLRGSHKLTEKVNVRINVFDYLSPKIKLVKKPFALPGLVIRDTHYQVRDISTGQTIIPFDTLYNSTRASSDSDGMYFELDMSNLRDQRSYTIDVLLRSSEGNEYVYSNASPDFVINSLR